MLSSLLSKKKIESFVSVDIGTSAIKVLQFEIGGEKPKLIAAGIAPTPANAINNNMITNPNAVGDAIRKLITESDVTATKATVSIPGPCVFSKKISVGYAPVEQIEETLKYEAANYIPHSINDVHMDFQVLSANKGSTADVLIVAVKNDILNSYIDAISSAGLEPGIVDVDYYALENMFELNYPEEAKRCVAIVNIGARYSAVNIVVDGKTVFSGDVGVGGRLFTDALVEALGMKPAEAEKIKSGGTGSEAYDKNVIKETLERTTDHVAAELHRQLGFFWNAAGLDRAIEGIFLCGGGAQSQGLLEELATRTGISCQYVDPFRNVDWEQSFDRDFLKELGPTMAVSVGTPQRQFGDKSHAL